MADDVKIGKKIAETKEEKALARQYEEEVALAKKALLKK